MKCKKIFLLTILINVMFLLFNMNVKADLIYLESNDTTSGLKKCIDENHSNLVNDNGTTWSIETDDFEELLCDSKTFTSTDIYNLKKFTNLKKISIGNSIFEGNLELEGNIDNIIFFRNTFNFEVNIKSAKKIDFDGTLNVDFIIEDVETILMTYVSSNNKISVKNFQTFEMKEHSKINFLSLSNGKKISIKDTLFGNPLIEELEIENVETVDINKATLSKLTLQDIDNLCIEENILKENLLLSGNFNTLQLINNQIKEIEFNELNITKTLYIEEETLEKLEIYNSRFEGFQFFSPKLKNILIEESNIPELFIHNIGQAALKEISVSNTELKKLELDYNVNLEKISILKNSKVLNFQVSNSASLEELFVDSSELPKDFDFSIIPGLKVLSIENSNLDSIDLSKNLNLESLYLSGNNLKSIDLSKNEKLKNLDLSNNKFSSLDLKNNVLLETLLLESNNWNEKGLSKIKQVVKLKSSLNFTELLVLPNGIDISKLNKRYYSSDESIATVDQDGNIKTLKEGKVDIILEYTLPTSDNKESSKFYEVNSLVVTKDGKIENPKTGIDLKYVAIIGLILIGGVGYLLIRKKIRFPKHN